MTRAQIRLVVFAFVFLHTGLGLFFARGEILSPNAVSHAFFGERDWIDVGFAIFWFPLGPLSGLFWGGLVYCLLRLFAERQEERHAN